MISPGTVALSHVVGNGEGGDSGDKSKTPVRVEAGAQGGGGFLSNVSQISAGANYTCAVTDADAAFCWGRNNYGQLGDGKKDQRTRFVQVVILVLSVLNSHNLLG